MPPKGKKKKITQVESADSPAVQETFATKKPRFRPNLTEDEEDLMLEFLRENQFLYDKKKKLYHNKHLREKAWNEQAARMDRDKADLEVWYDSLRTRYGKLLKGSSKSGSGASSLSDRDRWISSQMSFLKPFIADRRTAKPMVSFKQKTCSPSDIPPGEEEPSTSKESVTPPCDVNSEAGSSVCSKKRENLEDKLRQTEADQNQLLLLTKEFVQRYQGDPVRRSECDYFASVIYTLPHDVYRKVSREIHATLRAAIDETDRRNGQQHNVHPQNVQQQVPQHHVTHEYQPQVCITYTRACLMFVCECMWREREIERERERERERFVSFFPVLSNCRLLQQRALFFN